MAQTLSVIEGARHFEDYIDYIDCGYFRGESVVLVPGNNPVAKRLEELPSLLASLPHLSPTEGTQFADDLEAARRMLARAEVHDP